MVERYSIAGDKFLFTGCSALPGCGCVTHLCFLNAVQQGRSKPDAGTPVDWPVKLGSWVPQCPHFLFMNPKLCNERHCGEERSVTGDIAEKEI